EACDGLGKSVWFSAIYRQFGEAMSMQLCLFQPTMARTPGELPAGGRTAQSTPLRGSGAGRRPGGESVHSGAPLLGFLSERARPFWAIHGKVSGRRRRLQPPM